jgi:hypothetical protein
MPVQTQARSSFTKCYETTAHFGSKFLMPVVALLLWAFTLSAQPQSDVDVATSSAPPRWRLHREIRTSVPRASQLFDAGLSLVYAYRHRDAVDAFRAAQRADPRCIMCVLGEALALGPTIDAPESRSESDAREAVERAQALLRAGAGGVNEAAWVRAFACRHSAAPTATRASLDSAFAIALTRLADAHPTDADAQTLAAEALMILSPYQYWTDAGLPRRDTRRILTLLGRASREAPGHHGAEFLRTHVLETRSEFAGGPRLAKSPR